MEIYLTSLGKSGYDVFQSMAMFFSSYSWEHVIPAFIGLGGMIAAFQFMFKPNMAVIWKWAFVVVFIPAITISGKTSVTIADTSDPLAYYTVDNVPIGLALPASITTAGTYGIQSLIQDIFHTPDDVSYQRTGMVFQARIFEDTNKFHLDEDIQKLFTAYINNCVVDDIDIRKKYTWHALFTAPDIFDFLQKNSGYNRFDEINIDGQKVTCSEALPILKSKVKGSSSLAIATMASSLKSESNPEVDKFDVNEAIRSAYKDYFRKSSASSQEIMMQNLAINGIKTGLKNMAGSSDSSAAALNYSNTLNKASSESFMWSAGQTAQETIPMMASVFFLLFICSFIPVMILACFPSMTYTCLVSYYKGFIYFGTWGIYFTFINYIQQSILSMHANMLIDSAPLSVQGFTLSQQDPLIDLTYRYASVAGYLMLLTPWIAQMTEKGVSSVMNTLATSVMTRQDSSLQKATDGMTSGNYNDFNTSIGNHSANNVSDNKHDTNAVDKFGAKIIQNANGTISTTNRDNSMVADSGSSGGNYAWSAQASEGKVARETTTAQQSATHALNSMDQLADRAEHTHGEGSSDTSTKSAEASQAADNMRSILRGHKLENGKTIDESGGISKNIDTFGVTADGRITIRNHDGHTESLTADESSKFSENLRVLNSSSHTDSTNNDDRYTASLANDLSSNLSKSMAASQAVSDESHNNVQYSRDISEKVADMAAHDNLFGNEATTKSLLADKKFMGDKDNFEQLRPYINQVADDEVSSYSLDKQFGESNAVNNVESANTNDNQNINATAKSQGVKKDEMQNHEIYEPLKYEPVRQALLDGDYHFEGRDVVDNHGHQVAVPNPYEQQVVKNNEKIDGVNSGVRATSASIQNENMLHQAISSNNTILDGDNNNVGSVNLGNTNQESIKEQRADTVKRIEANSAARVIKMMNFYSL